MGKGADVSSKYAVGSDAPDDVAAQPKAEQTEEDGTAPAAEEIVCAKCGSSHDGEPKYGKKLLVCGACGKGYHNACLKPALKPDEIPFGTWYCVDCRRKYSPDYSTFEEEADISDPHRSVPVIQPPGLVVSIIRLDPPPARCCDYIAA